MTPMESPSLAIQYRNRPRRSRFAGLFAELAFRAQQRRSASRGGGAEAGVVPEELSVSAATSDSHIIPATSQAQSQSQSQFRGHSTPTEARVYSGDEEDNSPIPEEYRGLGESQDGGISRRSSSAFSSPPSQNNWENESSISSFRASTPASPMSSRAAGASIVEHPLARAGPCPFESRHQQAPLLPNSWLRDDISASKATASEIEMEIPTLQCATWGRTGHRADRWQSQTLRTTLEHAYLHEHLHDQPDNDIIQNGVNAASTAAARAQGQIPTSSVVPMPPPQTSLKCAITRFTPKNSALIPTPHHWNCRAGVRRRGYGSHLQPVVGHVTTV
ncbi:hypothetical protein Z517_09052 [Fonsecaea pedrosoi CBS 271.37]|uniref:Uncharacterized protein n=1 Tax=Fonsecaea pedrosoi CBS 271.37 TaxID=1442368 RepID=A0A0D2G7I8_9EURO|nr:uncharacterized protein Z517_09052 [Fonsecaea pedrosoi CBS 271.37]KIW76608.1 hypothetical protein Z517_09052 [Fonsecaea pedrosoi CBS 271.37]